MFDEYFAVVKYGNPTPSEDDGEWVWSNKLSEASCAAIRDYIDNFEDEIQDGEIQKVLVYKNLLWCNEAEFQHEGDYSFQIRFSRTEGGLEWQETNRPEARPPRDAFLDIAKLANDGFLEEAGQELTRELRINRGLSDELEVILRRRGS